MNDVECPEGDFLLVLGTNVADARIGAIVIEELDFVRDCTRQALLPRIPHRLFGDRQQRNYQRHPCAHTICVF